MRYRLLEVDYPENTVAVVALARPEAANALNTDMAVELKTAFSGMKKNIRTVVLTGRGRHFCAGADLKERQGMDEKAWETQHQALRAARDAVLHCPLPVIAAVNGAAYGGGLELALACDFIYAARTARFALTEAKLGIMPGLGGTQGLARAIGPRRARELLFAARPFSAEEAHAWGMVNRLCEPASLLSDVLACAEEIVQNAPLAVRAIKAAVLHGAHLPPEEALAAELTHYRALVATRDRQEGITAFNEKRKPVFTGT